MTGTLKTLSFRNLDGELVDVPTVAATRFKNEFGAIFEQAALGGAVAITKHNTPKAVLLSYAEFEALTKSASPALDELTTSSTSCSPGCRPRPRSRPWPPHSTPRRKSWAAPRSKAARASRR